MSARRRQTVDEVCALAAAYTLGSLSPEERAQFEAHLSAGCARCERELREFEKVAGELGLTPPPAAPPAALRQRLRERIASSAAQPEKRPVEEASPELGVLLRQPGLLISSTRKMAWQEVAPGILCKRLFRDPERAYVTSLLKIQPGTHYPSHRHADVEEIFVLEGDLHLHGVVMRAGDYCRAEPQSVHLQTYTEAGCLLLQLTSERDQLLA